MLYTAAKLSKLTEKIIVLTGAARPERFTDSDASFNIGMAIGAIHAFRQVPTQVSGVFIAMSGVVVPWNECSRIIETGQFAKERETNGNHRPFRNGYALKNVPNSG